jgi:hypothetical protein
MNLRIHHRVNPQDRQSPYRVKSYGKFYRGEDLLDGLIYVGHPNMYATVNVVLNKLRETEPNKSVYSFDIETK